MGAAYQGDSIKVGEPQNEEEARGRDCISPAAEDFLRGLTNPKLRGKVLMTTRLRPHVLEGHIGNLQPHCLEVGLTALTPADAYEFFTVKEKINASRAEVEAACAPYGYHPLSLNLLAGLIKKDFEFRGDIKAAQKYQIGEIKNHKEHILKIAYETLPIDRQLLLSKIACFRGSVTYEIIKIVFIQDHLDEVLVDLQERGLLQITDEINIPIGDVRNVWLDLNPIVRRYAYDRLSTAEKIATHIRLADYFAAVPIPQIVATLEDLAPVVELYHHVIRAGNFDKAIVLYRDRLRESLFFHFCSYQLLIEMLSTLFDREDKPPKLNKKDAQAYTLNELANAYALSGQPRRAIPLLEMQIAIRENNNDMKNVAIGLGNMADDQMKIGALAQSEHNLCRSIKLSLTINDEFVEAVGHQEFGRLLSYRGAWQVAEQELATSTKYWEKSNDVQGYCIDESYRSFQRILMFREAMINNGSSTSINLQVAIEHAKHSLELADEWARIEYPKERDYVRIHWLLGAAYRISANLHLAEEHLSKALNRCRTINNVEHEADILLELAKLHHAQQENAEALSLTYEALIIAGRSEFVLQEADVHLFLAELALEGMVVDGEQGSNTEVALAHARKARRLAICDGGDYTYKIAYEEAGKLFERLGSEIPA
jgi:tetratricopeptide (TPR) repeat protein